VFMIGKPTVYRWERGAGGDACFSGCPATILANSGFGSHCKAI